MRISLVNQSKFRDGRQVGDDVPLVVPGRVYGVFDGATDPRGTIVEGIGAGRLAALSVAAATADLAALPDIRDLPGAEIIRRLSAALLDRTQPLNLPIPPSTTLAAALDCGPVWRFVLLGDSGIRLNGAEVLRHEKIIDAVSTVARVAVFRRLRQDIAAPDAVERATRRAILLGLDRAVAELVLDRPTVAAAIAQAVAETGLQDSSETIGAFLAGGLQTQFRFGNATGSPLCFDTLNGALPQLGHVIDIERPKRGIHSIEIFSDGYPDLPGAVTTDAWEAAFQEAETVDFHKIGPFATVKGSTTEEFFDDRTILILSDLPQPG